MRIRSLSESDKPFLAEVIAMEPTHSHTPEFYFEPMSEGYMLEDEIGSILGFRIARSLRINCDFDKRHRLRSSKALVSGLTWLMEKAKKAGFKELVFETQSKDVIRFCEKRFGFRSAPNEMRVSL